MKTSRRAAPPMHPAQLAYSVALVVEADLAAKRDAAFAAGGAALALTEGMSEADFLRVSEARDDIAEALGYFKAHDARVQAELAMVKWSIEHAQAFSPSHAEAIGRMYEGAKYQPKVWAKLVSIAVRLAA